MLTGPACEFDVQHPALEETSVCRVGFDGRAFCFVQGL